MDYHTLKESREQRKIPRRCRAIPSSEVREGSFVDVVLAVITDVDNNVDEPVLGKLWRQSKQQMVKVSL